MGFMAKELITNFLFGWAKEKAKDYDIVYRKVVISAHKSCRFYYGKKFLNDCYERLRIVNGISEYQFINLQTGYSDIIIDCYQSRRSMDDVRVVIILVCQMLNKGHLDVHEIKMLISISKFTHDYLQAGVKPRTS